MDIMELGAVGELVGGVAVVASLVFVGIQVQASRRQDRIAMLTALDRSWNEINSQLSQNGPLSTIFFKGMASPEELSEEEGARFFTLCAQYINIHCSVWALIRDHQLSSRHEQWFRWDVDWLYGTPGVWKVFQLIEGSLERDFIDFVSEHRREGLGFRWSAEA